MFSHFSHFRIANGNVMFQNEAPAPANYSDPPAHVVRNHEKSVASTRNVDVIPATPPQPASSALDDW